MVLSFKKVLCVLHHYPPFSAKLEIILFFGAITLPPPLSLFLSLPHMYILAYMVNKGIKEYVSCVVQC